VQSIDDALATPDGRHYRHERTIDVIEGNIGPREQQKVAGDRGYIQRRPSVPTLFETQSQGLQLPTFKSLLYHLISHYGKGKEKS
jgi:hypothetical protein